MLGGTEGGLYVHDSCWGCLPDFCKGAGFKAGPFNGGFPECSLADAEAGVAVCGPAPEVYSVKSLRVFVEFSNCAGYYVVAFAARDGESAYLAPGTVSPCPVLVLNGEVYAPAPSLYDEAVLTFAEVGLRPVEAWSHLWTPYNAGGRPARFSDGVRAVFLDGSERGVKPFRYPMDYTSPLAELYGVEGGGYITKAFKAPGRGGLLGERFSVYLVEGDYLQVETPWGVDFALNFVLGTYQGRWVLMGTDGLYEGVFVKKEGAGGKVGYVEVVKPFEKDVRLVEGPADLPRHVFCTRSVRSLGLCELPGGFNDWAIVDEWGIIGYVSLGDAPYIFSKKREMLTWPL